MAITFNTNVSALTAQRYLGIAGDKTASSLAKLSSGSRVPTAKDDAAGLAIGSKLRAEVAGLNQAANNAAQAVSLLQIADGALSTIGDVLVRMKSLATQSSSGQLADAERSLLNQEFTNLRTEIDRIANITNFNGTTLLNGGDVRAEATELKDGGLSSRGLSVSFDTSKVHDASTAARAAGDIADSFRIDYSFAANGTSADTGNLTVYNLRTGASQTLDVASAVRALTGETSNTLTTDLSPGQTVTMDFSAVGVKVTLDSNFNVDSSISTTPSEASYAGDADVATALTVVNVNNGGLTDSVIKALRASSFYNESTGQITLEIDETQDTTVDTISFDAITGIRYAVNGVTTGAGSPSATMNADTNNVIDVYFDDTTDGAGGTVKLFTLNYAAQNATTAITASTTDSAYVVNFGDMVFGADEISTSTKTFNFKVGTGNGTTDTNNVVGFTLSAATNAALGISSTTVDTQSNADAAITTLTNAITTVSSRRADIGANQSRLDFAAASVNVAIENTTAAQSALLDVDVSQEITDFTSQQVLLQAGVSLLAQANQQPALLLRLLQ